MRGEVERLKDLKSVKDNFVEKIEAWDTLVLLGRNSLWAMEYHERIPPISEGEPIAAKTAHKWVLIGPKGKGSTARNVPASCNTTYFPRARSLSVLFIHQPLSQGEERWLTQDTIEQEGMFHSTKDDEHNGLSQLDVQFMSSNVGHLGEARLSDI